MIGALAAGAIAIVGGVWHRHTASACHIDPHDTPPVSYTLTPEQATIATTIAAVAKRLGLADHAVTVGLAAALQESKLQNLAHGDRDSLGVFQQRPSQGWGTASEVMDPAFAAQSFFTHLARVDNWENIPVTTAAQEVQRSGAPNAYAAWEPEARVLARALTGQAPAAFTCTWPKPDTSSTRLAETMDRELGTAAASAVKLGTTVSVQHGWTIAAWLVAHARQFGISAVTFDGYRWTPKATRWSHPGPASPRVRIESYLKS